MGDDGRMTIGERFASLENRMKTNELLVSDMRIEFARAQVKLAVIIGGVNLVLFAIVEACAVHFGK